MEAEKVLNAQIQREMVSKVVEAAECMNQGGQNKGKSEGSPSIMIEGQRVTDMGLLKVEPYMTIRVDEEDIIEFLQNPERHFLIFIQGKYKVVTVFL